MLNDVLHKIKDMGIFESIGKEKSHEFALEMIKVGKNYHCNDGEILNEIGEELGICYYCLKESEDIEKGLCKECRG